ncbi:hypothetical protein ACWIBQ_02590 [Microbacterium keratanolyticum]
MNDMQQAMSGGNMNTVVRDGDTVRRVGGPWTPTVHRYLRYLERGGRRDPVSSGVVPDR